MPHSLDQALVEAVRSGDIESVRLLLDKGADLNVKDDEGRTALMLANRADIVRTLTNNRADIDAKDLWGDTALMYAARYSLNGILKALLDAGADVNAKNTNGETALMWASWCQVVRVSNYVHLDLVVEFSRHPVRTYTVQTLLEGGADVNAKSEKGYTALMLASYIGHTKVVKALLAAGANVNARDKDGETALQWTAWPEIVQLLKQAGAKE